MKSSRQQRRAWAAAVRKYTKRGSVLRAEIQHDKGCAIYTPERICTCKPYCVLKDMHGRELVRVVGAGYSDPLEPIEIFGGGVAGTAQDADLNRKVAAGMAIIAQDADLTRNLAAGMAEDVLRQAGGHAASAAARALIADGFEDLIRNAGRPIVRQITAEQAALLPGCGQAPAGAQWWIGFGLDVDGGATWTTCWIWRPGLDPDEVRELKEVAMLERLAAICNVSGLPEVR
jgi:hypothetical protein